MSYVHNPCAFYEVAIRLEVCVLLLQGWPTSQRPTATFLTVLQERAASCTWWAHMNVTPSLPHLRTYFCLARFSVNITHYQHDNDRTSQAFVLCLLFIGTSALRASWNWAMSCMWLVSRGLATPVLLYSVSAQNENELVQYLNAFW